SMRGILVSLMVVDHYTPGLAARGVTIFQWCDRYLQPIFNWATPGFAVAFGMTLGVAYYPLYRNNRRRMRSLTRWGAVIVGLTGLFYWILRWAIDPWAAGSLPLDNPLAYYFLALVSVELWFRAISLNRFVVPSAIGLAVAFAAIHRLLVARLAN